MARHLRLRLSGGNEPRGLASLGPKSLFLSPTLSSRNLEGDDITSSRFPVSGGPQGRSPGQVPGLGAEPFPKD